MTPLETLNLLEDKIHQLTVRFTQTSEENSQLKEQLDNEKNKNKKLSSEIERLKKEIERSEIIKLNVKKKIENLIEQISFEDEHVKDDKKVFASQQLHLDNNKLASKPSTKDILSDTAINFFPEEDNY